MKAKAPFGFWNSPVSKEMLTEKSRSINELAFSKTNDTLYWNEGRPEEKGRCAIMSYKNGKMHEVVKAPFNVRSKVHEYGGGSFQVCGDILFFINFSDQTIYQQISGVDEPIFSDPNYRFSEIVMHVPSQSIFAICEHHTKDQVENLIARIDLNGKSLTPLVTGHDFFACLTLNPSSNAISYIAWDHPNMPWDTTVLYETQISKDGFAAETSTIFKQENTSACYPKYSPKGNLYFIADQTGFWNFYKKSGSGIEQVTALQVDFGWPIWILGQSRYCFVEDSIYAIYTEKGIDHICQVDLDTKDVSTLELPYTSLRNICTDGTHLFFQGASAMEMDSIIKFNRNTLERETIRSTKELHLDNAFISSPERIEFPSGDAMSHAFYYPPCNPDYEGIEGELPPLIVKIHGGPTANTPLMLSLEALFFTTRGFGYMVVNYGGSTGFGRSYRERLKNNWGIVDVQDSANAALYLSQKGHVDPKRMAIKGGSAGGFTTLAALCFTDVFSAGASYCGVTDLEMLANDTHKFESHYLEGLIGPYPEAKEIYEKRSPMHNIDKIKAPVLLLQGGKDKVVPQSQADLMYDELTKRQVPATYIIFDQEGHGFRNAENIKKALQNELEFYQSVFLNES